MTVPTTEPPTFETAPSDLGERRIVDELIEPRYRKVPGFGDDCAPPSVASR